MSVSAKWTVTGIAEAQARIQQGIEKFNTVPNQVFQTVGAQMVSAMQGKAPVRTGFLRDHIVQEQETNQLIITSEAPYSVFVEFGTSRMAPREFFFSVIYEFEPQILEQIRNGILI